MMDLNWRSILLQTCRSLFWMSLNQGRVVDAQYVARITVGSIGRLVPEFVIARFLQ